MSNYKTLSKLTQDVITNLSMYRGTATQIYAEDRIAATIVRLFNRIFDERFWKEHTHWFKYTLSGNNGVCEENVSNDIAKFSDIYSISTEENPRNSLKNLHSTSNPFLIKGKSARYFIPTQEENKIFAVVPYEATGNIYVRARVRPKRILINTVIPFDPDVLIYGASYEYCADDGNSSLQTQKFMQQYQERLNQLKVLDNDTNFDYNDEVCYNTSSEWVER